MYATRFVITLPRLATTAKEFKTPATNFVRLLANDAKTGIGRASHQARRRTMKEMAMSPTTGTPFSIGQGFLAGASAIGLGGLMFYGLGFSNEVGAAEKAMIWPAHVKQRIRDTYMYFGASLGVTAGTAVAIFRSPAMMNIVARQGMVAMGVSIAAMIGSGMLVRSIPYQEGFGSKQMAWLLHSAVVGAVVAPIMLLGGPILTRAAWYTAGVVGGLTTVAVTAPSDKFLYMGGPLAMGFGVVFMASIGSAFLPPTTALGAGMASISLYGGLVLFSGFMLYNTQKIIHRAENHSQYSMQKYDPINNSVGIYLDTINIFIRIATILAGQRRK